jgi:Tol biopolymer transport system component
VLAYRTGNSGQNTQLSWFNRDGKRIADVGVPQASSYLGLSPDEKRVAVSVDDSTGGGGTGVDLWVHDMDRGARTRFTFDPAFDSYPVWSPDGGRIAFCSLRDNKRNLYIKAASGAGGRRSPVPIA